MDQKTVLLYVVSVPLITWAGLFTYLLMVDRSLRKLEHQDKEQDEL
jgi:hypothetical protein